MVELDHFKMQAGLPSFVLSPSQIIEQTNAIGIYVKSGRYGGTYAHKDIAFEFGSAISAVLSRYAKCCIIRQNRTFSSMSPETIFPSITGCRSY